MDHGHNHDRRPRSTDPADHGHGDRPGFDERAATWDEHPGHIERADASAAAIAAAIPLTGATRLLEYGAGTAMVSQRLAPSVGSIDLADTSVGMREVMAAKIEAGLLPGAAIIDLDVAEPMAGAEPRYDLIVTVMTLHHLPDPAVALANFAALLANGGHVAIVDLVTEDGSFHGEGADVHHGFDRDELISLMTGAGFDKVTIEQFHIMQREQRSYPIFLATGSVAVR